MGTDVNFTIGGLTVEFSFQTRLIIDPLAQSKQEK
jgi:hypothetical protein